MPGNCRPSIIDKTLYHVQNSNGLSETDKKCIKSALEKQIPKKPIPIRTEYDNRIITYGCPNCKHQDLGNNEYKFDRCEVCGQALDWS